MEKLEYKIENLIAPLVKEMGFFLLDVSSGKRGGEITVTVDRPEGGIMVQETTALCREINSLLEIEGVKFSSLRVSSPGLDRVLRKPREFKWAVGKRVKVCDRKGNVQIGILTEVDEDGITLRTEKLGHFFPYKELKKAQLKELEQC